PGAARSAGRARRADPGDGCLDRGRSGLPGPDRARRTRARTSARVGRALHARWSAGAAVAWARAARRGRLPEAPPRVGRPRRPPRDPGGRADRAALPSVLGAETRLQRP